jgi:hypothetical protein
MSVTSWLVREHLAVGTFPRLLWRVIAGRPAALITAMGVTLEDLLAAVEGGDRETRVWVRGHELIHGTYEGRPHEALLGLADEARAISTEPGMGSGSIRTGRAQILAIQGRKAEARAALAEAAEMAERLPARVTGETVSLFGWPEYCLRHTESLVYTHLGDRRKAEAAQDRALALYPETMFRARADIRLHQALGLVQAGDPAAGARLAVEALVSVPAAQRTQITVTNVRKVIRALPAAERDRPDASELRELVAASASPVAG